jgi:multiple sugar transport system substrate-binding protein
MQMDGRSAGMAMVSRRRFVFSGALSGVAVLAAACGQAPPPTVAPAATSVPAPTAAPAGGGAAQPAPTKPAAAPQAAAPASGGGQPVTVIFHSLLEDPKDEFWGPLQKKFEAEHPNIKIERQWFPEGEIDAKQLALAATGQIGDLVRARVAPLTTELRIKNVIQPLDQYVKGDKAWFEQDHPQFWPGNIATYSYQGQQYGYPIVGHPGSVQHYYNIDYLTQKGVGLPPADVEKMTFDYSKWKQADLLAIVKNAVTTGGDGRISTYGFQQGVSGEGAVSVLRSFGGNYYSEDGTKSLINTPESIAGLQYLSDFWNTLKVAIPLSASPDYTQTFPTQQVAMFNGTAVAASVDKVVGTKFKWSVAPPPIGPIGKPATQVSSNGITMSKTTKHPAEAWEVMKLTLTKEFGLRRFLAGLGSPGSRYDVWTDPEFKKAVPLLATVIYDSLIDPKKAPPLMPWHHPANGTFKETDAAYLNTLRPIFDGKISAKEGAEAAHKAVQAIMDKPAT